MSADLVKRWRRLTREYDHALTAIALGNQQATERAIGEAQGYAKALRWCADSLERSLKRKRAKEGK